MVPDCGLGLGLRLFRDLTLGFSLGLEFRIGLGPRLAFGHDLSFRLNSGFSYGPGYGLFLNLILRFRIETKVDTNTAINIFINEIKTRPRIILETKTKAHFLWVKIHFLGPGKCVMCDYAFHL